MKPETVTIEAPVDGSFITIWEHYTATARLPRRNFAPDDWCCAVAENDLRVGNTYRARMGMTDGSFGFDFVAVYDEVVAQEALSLVLADGRTVRVTFTPTVGGTKVTTVFDAETEYSVEQPRDGWQAILNNFKACAETA
ncbi:hypothetical protein RGUI_1108 [Rhodovulum sp. P5]|uniref:SRPBCC domain-containing protein n=1 Tax=Rhodovulum sp. P5 TaxID=1564506 RepID=UPI0009C1E49E|nr:SRPBCC domain-containing protein [Rhodovulum sp. P5]ARE39249.1 hypothetical protein RGUI_1108 [Rhodovulum sp. P5]